MVNDRAMQLYNEMFQNTDRRVAVMQQPSTQEEEQEVHNNEQFF